MAIPRRSVAYATPDDRTTRVPRQPRPPRPPPAALRPRPPSPPPPPIPSIPAGETVYILDLIRRVALQRDLAGAVGVIHLGLSELIAARVACAFVAPDGVITCPRADDLRAAAAVVRMDAIAAFARNGRAAVTPRAIIIPIPITGATRAAIVAHRAPTAPELDRRDVAVATAVATQAAPVLHGLLIAHAHAPRAARRDGKRGSPIQLTRGWVRWAYPAVLALVLGLIAAAALIDIPTYSTGPALVTIAGEEITSPAGGTVAAVAVRPGQSVAEGAELVRLHAGNERTAAAVEAHVIRATKAGMVSDIRVKPGALLAPGGHVLTIVDRDTEPEVIALLPGSDRPRLRPGMTLQLALSGYTKAREDAEITEVGAEVIGPTEARRYLGERVGDTLAIAGPVVIVRARLPGRTFDAGGATYAFHDGMPGLGEVQTASRSFLSTLISQE